MSPLTELREAAGRILSRTDAEIERIQHYLSTETEQDLRAGHLAEIERLEQERDIVVYVKRAEFGGLAEQAIEEVAQEEMDAARYGRHTIQFPGR